MQRDFELEVPKVHKSCLSKGFLGIAERKIKEKARKQESKKVIIRLIVFKIIQMIGDDW